MSEGSNPRGLFRKPFGANGGTGSGDGTNGSSGINHQVDPTETSTLESPAVARPASGMLANPVPPAARPQSGMLANPGQAPRPSSGTWPNVGQAGSQPSSGTWPNAGQAGPRPGSGTWPNAGQQQASGPAWNVPPQGRPATGQLQPPPQGRPATGQLQPPQQGRPATGQLQPQQGRPATGQLQPPQQAPFSGQLQAPGQQMPSSPVYHGPSAPLSSPANGVQAAPWQQAEAHAAKQKKQKVKIKERVENLSLRGKIVLCAVLICILVPFVVVVLEGINAYVLYSQARSGIQHLTNIQGIFSGAKGHTELYFDQNKLRQAQQELDAAHEQFQQISDQLDQDGFISMIGGVAPQQVNAIRGLSRIGADATAIGQQLMKSAIKLAPQLAAGLRDTTMANAANPIVTQQTMDEARADIDVMIPLVHDMALHSRGLSLEGLPISDKQRQQLNEILPVIPQADLVLPQVRTFLGAIGWMVGVDGQRTFLVQTMDRGELRATGGFTGQFGAFSFNGGHTDMAHFNLQNIGSYEEGIVQPKNQEEQAVFSKVLNNPPPAPYDWWPIPNFGLRDSNVSADFPTSAQLAMDAYKNEFGQQVDGVIVLSPFAIAHVLQVTGPISIPEYQETITAQNLEERLHYYQLDNQGIFKEVVVEHVPQTPDNPSIAGNQARKLFTKRLSKVLIDHVMHAPAHEILAIANEMLYAMKTKDLQVYVTNQQIEDLIGKYGSKNLIDRSADHDGLFVVQENLSVSKAAQYVRTNIQDTVTLDANGGATHEMQMRLAYTQIGQVYGLDTYRDYVRVYVPQGSQLLGGNGFTQFGEPFCGDYLAACKQDVYGNGVMVCPSGSNIGQVPNISVADFTVDQVGPPTNKSTDEQGREMFGGWVVMPKNCNITVTLSWYVPPMGHSYSLLIQRQSSTFPIVDLTIQTTPGSCSVLKTAGLHFSGVMGGEDMMFTPKASGSGAACYPQSKV